MRLAQRMFRKKTCHFLSRLFFTFQGVKCFHIPIDSGSVSLFFCVLWVSCSPVEQQKLANLTDNIENIFWKWKRNSRDLTQETLEYVWGFGHVPGQKVNKHSDIYWDMFDCSDVHIRIVFFAHRKCFVSKRIANSIKVCQFGETKVRPFAKIQPVLHL